MKSDCMEILELIVMSIGTLATIFLGVVALVQNRSQAKSNDKSQVKLNDTIVRQAEIMQISKIIDYSVTATDEIKSASFSIMEIIDTIRNEILEIINHKNFELNVSIIRKWELLNDDWTKKCYAFEDALLKDTREDIIKDSLGNSYDILKICTDTFFDKIEEYIAAGLYDMIENDFEGIGESYTDFINAYNVYVKYMTARLTLMIYGNNSLLEIKKMCFLAEEQTDE